MYVGLNVVHLHFIKTESVSSFVSLFEEHYVEFGSCSVVQPCSFTIPEHVDRSQGIHPKRIAL